MNHDLNCADLHHAVITADDFINSAENSTNQRFAALKKLLADIKTFVDAVDRHRHLLSYSRMRSRPKDDKPPRDDQLVNRFISLAAQFQKLDYCYPLQRYPMQVEIFEESLNHYFKYGIPTDPKSVDVQRIMDCIYQIHSTMRDPKVREELRCINRRYDNQEKCIIDLINRLFECHSKLLVLRIDLGYKANSNSTLLQAKQDMERFVEYIRESQSQHVGYIWKLEYGLQKGYHYHVLVFLDGQALRGDVTYAKNLCKRWVQDITEDTGVAYNCNANKERYPECYLGLVHYDETGTQGKRTWLEQHALYLAKPDLLFEIAQWKEASDYRRVGDIERARSIQYAREFGTSRLPPLPENRRGRPRCAYKRF